MLNQLDNFNDIRYEEIHNNDKITYIIISYKKNILYTFIRDGKIKKCIIINIYKI